VLRNFDPGFSSAFLQLVLTVIGICNHKLSQRLKFKYSTCYVWWFLREAGQSPMIMRLFYTLSNAEWWCYDVHVSINRLTYAEFVDLL